MAQPAAPVALLFSAGTDSLSILWALLDVGIVPTCYTFRLPEVESTDYTMACKAARHLGLQHRIIVAGPDTADDVRAAIGIINSARKTHVEVMYAYRLLMARVEEADVFSGIQADTLYGSNKRAAIACSKADAATFRKYRLDLLANPGQEGLYQALRVAAYYGKRLRTPYTTGAVREWFLRWSWADLNKPRQKMPVWLGFADRYTELPIYRMDDNLQCGSGIRERMAAAFGGRQRAAYRSILADVIAGQYTLPNLGGRE